MLTFDPSRLPLPHHLHHQFPGLSQSSNSNLGDSSSDSGGDITCSKGTDMCHRPLVFLSSAPPSLPNTAPAPAPYPQPLSPQGRLHHHHHQHHPLHTMHGSHHHHHHPQMNQVHHLHTSIQTGRARLMIIAVFSRKSSSIKPGGFFCR